MSVVYTPQKRRGLFYARRSRAPAERGNHPTIRIIGSHAALSGAVAGRQTTKHAATRFIDALRRYAMRSR